jgi:PleD family two-component response regulator
MDVMSKLDNGEFVVMMPGSTKTESGYTVKKMRAATDTCILPLQDRELRICLRHGIAELKSGETAQELLARARQEIVATPATTRAANN